MSLLAGWRDAAWCLVALVLLVGVLWGVNAVINEVDKVNKGGKK